MCAAMMAGFGAQTYGIALLNVFAGQSSV